VIVQRVEADTNTPADSKFLEWVESALNSAKGRAVGIDKSAELTIRVVGRDESAEFNRQYRNKSGPTNILSFPFEKPEGLPVEAALNFPLGDLLICSPLVVEEAHSQNRSVESHWAHLVVHGVLHLLGMDHIGNSDAEEMESMEAEILANMGISDPYLDRC